MVAEHIDFDQKAAEFRSAYEAFCSLLRTYPPDRSEQPGACGFWSPRQVVAHLSGWIAQASKRYADFAAGDHRSLYFHSAADEFNARSVQSRANLNWQETIADFEQSAQEFLEQLTAVLPEQQRSDPRYAEWPVGLAHELRNHAEDLRRFLHIPLLEHNGSVEPALIEPGRVLKPLDTMPEACVLCFFQEALTKVVQENGAQAIYNLGSEIGPNPVYVLEIEGRRIGLAHPGVGAPLAAAFLEELIALGARKFIACGGAGVLNSELAVGHVVIPISAIRDEGTSYHYLPPAREVPPSPQALPAIERVLERHAIPYISGKTWTTDAIYRETPEKIRRRREEGCLTVEMEAAAFFAVAQFRGAAFGQILYCGDDVGGEEWDHRNWHRRASVREKMLWLALEAACEL